MSGDLFVESYRSPPSAQESDGPVYRHQNTSEMRNRKDERHPAAIEIVFVTHVVARLLWDSLDIYVS